jgi:hypothetical protein
MIFILRETCTTVREWACWCIVIGINRKSKDWLAQNQDNVSKWGDLSIRGLLSSMNVSDWLLFNTNSLTNFSAISWREQVNFQCDDDEVGFVLDQLGFLCINGVGSNPVEGRTKIWQKHQICITLQLYKSSTSKPHLTRILNLNVTAKF